MKRTLIVALAIISFSSFADVKQVDVISGDKVKINVMDCGRDEEALFKLNNKSGIVTTSCELATCQAFSKSGKYNVYRYQGAECEWNGCSEKAKLVGSFKSSKRSLKQNISSFLKQSGDCGKVRVFISGFHGFTEVTK